MTIDLHTHSTASDGLLAPAALVEAARAAGVTILALTDHDSTDGIEEARLAGDAIGVEVIAGVEINTDLEDGSGEAHMLGYFLDWQVPVFARELMLRREARERRGKQMVQQLQAIGLPITWEQVLLHADGAVGRPHVAEALMDSGVVTSVNEAFERYLIRGKPGYVAREPFTPVEAIALIHSANGVASLAHPAGILTLETLLPGLVAAGLVGLETYYGQYDEATVTRLLSLGRRYGLVPTGGSDYHGPGIHPTPLGGHPVPGSALDALRAKKRT